MLRMNLPILWPVQVGLTGCNQHQHITEGIDTSGHSQKQKDGGMEHRSLALLVTYYHRLIVKLKIGF